MMCFLKDFFILFFLCFFLVPFPVLAQSSREISFSQALHIAFDHNPRAHISAAQIESAQALVSETRARVLPKLNVELHAARSDDPLAVFASKLSQANVSFADFGLNQYTGPASIDTKPRALNNPGYYSNFNSAFKLSLPLYEGGASVARKQRAQALLQGARLGHVALKMQLAYEILQAYESVLTSAQLIHIAQQSVDAANDYLDMTQSLFAHAQVIESDVLLSKTHLRVAKMNLSEIKIERQKHLDLFRLLIGKPNSQYQPSKTVALPKQTQNLSFLLKKALIHNADVQAKQAKLEASRADIVAAKARYFPQVNLELRHDWNTNFEGASLPSNTGALAFDWLIFSSGEQSAKVKKTIAAFKQASFEFDESVNQLRQALLQAKHALALATIQDETSLANFAEAKASNQMLRARYGRALIPLGQLLESQMNLDRVRQMKVLAEYHQILAQGQLLMLTNSLIASQRSPA